MAQKESKKMKLDNEVEMEDAPSAPTESVDGVERAGGEDDGDANDGRKAVGKDVQLDDGESAEPKKGRKSSKKQKSAEEEAEEAAKKACEKAATEAVSRVCRSWWWWRMPPKYSLTNSIALERPFCVEGWQTRTVRKAETQNER